MAQEVCVDKMKEVAALPYADAIEAIAFLGTYIVVAEKIVRAGRCDRDGLRPGGNRRIYSL